jgi:hypothetical protein
VEIAIGNMLVQRSDVTVYKVLIYTHKGYGGMQSKQERTTYLIKNSEIGLGSHKRFHHVDETSVGGAVQSSVPVLFQQQHHATHLVPPTKFNSV